MEDLSNPTLAVPGVRLRMQTSKAAPTQRVRLLALDAAVKFVDDEL
jgi:hypothetical protein